MRCFGMRLAGDRLEEVDERGRRIEGDTILVLFNAHHEGISFNLPATLASQRWERLLDTAHPSRLAGDVSSPYRLGDRSLALFRTRRILDAESERISPDVAHVLLAGSRD